MTNAALIIFSIAISMLGVSLVVERRKNVRLSNKLEDNFKDQLHAVYMKQYITLVNCGLSDDDSLKIVEASIPDEDELNYAKKFRRGRSKSSVDNSQKH